MKTKSLTYLAAGILIALAGGVSATNAASSSITFCVNKSTQVVTKKNKCSKAESVLVVPTRGVQGLPGTQGIKGDQGPIGPTGLQGLTGAQGMSGTSLKVYDRNNALLGLATSAEAYGQWHILMNGLPIAFNPNNGKVSDNGQSALFANSSCTGLPYLASTMGSVGVDRFTASDPYFSSVFTSSGARTGETKLAAVNPAGTNLVGTTPIYSQTEGLACTLQTDPFSNLPSAPGPTMYFVEMRFIGSVFDAPGPLRLASN